MSGVLIATRLRDTIRCRQRSCAARSRERWVFLGAAVDWLTVTPYVAIIVLVVVNAWIVSRIDIDVRPDD